MFELAAHNASDYLAGRGFPQGPWTAVELGGGVSNTVVLVEGGGCRVVLKQSLGKLRVEQDWFSDRDRIFRESGVMRALAPHMPPGSLPDVLFEDRANYLFAMSAAPAGARTWKELLLAGEVDCGVASRVARMLAALARATWRDPDWEREFGDQAVFDQLRLDPYYRSTAARHPGLRAQFEALVRQAGNRVCLVHGDWSPKNFLVGADSAMAIDFEVIHFGDPAFDAGFLLNHLLLKSFYRPQWSDRYCSAAARFWTDYLAGLPPDADWMEAATVRHLGGLLLARIDGKSPAEYIRSPDLRERIRAFAASLMLDPPSNVAAVFGRL